jgi:para-nitrobenzyl esterase
MYLSNKKIIKFRMVCLLSIVGACTDTVKGGADNSPRLTLNDKSVIVGKLAEGGRTESFLGVPFAQPPVGDLRWAPPQPLVKTTATSQKNEYAAACMQGDHIAKWYKNVAADFGGDPELIKHPEVSEDCLYLNIWRPAAEAQSAERLPVIVYIHGGSNKGGWSYEPNYIGHNLASKGVIVISIAYRLGVFGFFSHPTLEHSNFGLLDQIAALQWVNDNIIALGGDAERITVMGESAGANNIGHLVTMPAGEGLFSRAIHQSGGSFMTNRSDKETLLKLGSEFLGKSIGDENGNILSKIRQLPAETLIAAAKDVYSGYYFDPVVDGMSVMEPIMDTINVGKMHGVDLLIGSNNDDWLMDTDDNPDIEGWLQAEVTPSEADSLKALLKGQSDDRRKADLLDTAKHYVCPSLVLAKEASKLNHNAWVYHFTRQREGELAATMGAYHGAELPYIFDTHDDWLPTVEADHRLTNIMQTYWVNFAATGNPNQLDLPVWPNYSAENPNILSLGDEFFSSTHPSQKLCEFLAPS